MPKLLDTQSSGFADEFTNFLDGKRETARDVNDVVAGILNDVRSRGDAALIEATQKFDKFELTPQTMSFSPKDIAAARDDFERGPLDAFELAAQRLEDFHQRPIPDALSLADGDGVRLGYRLDGGWRRRPFCARWYRGISVFGIDERNPRQGGRRGSPSHGRPHAAWRG